MSDSSPIVSRRDVDRLLEDLGLVLVELDDSESPNVRLVVRAMPPSDVLRRPPPEERLERLRATLRVRGVLGVRWLLSLSGDGPYRAPGSGG